MLSSPFTAVSPSEDYIDNALPSVERAEFERHLAECEVCSREWSAQQKFASMVEAVRRTSALQEHQVLGQLTTQVRRRIRNARLWRTVQMVAMGLLIAVGIWGTALRHPVKHHLRDKVTVRTNDLTATTNNLADDVDPTNGNDVARPTVVAQSIDSSFLAVPVETHNPEVTIIWFHSTVETASSIESEPSSSLSFPKTSTLARSS